MARILALDYGTKRIGVAVTDENQIIATGLDTIHPQEIFQFLKKYMSSEMVESIVVGDPEPIGTESREMKRIIDTFVNKLKKEFPSVPVFRFNERFTSVAATRAIREAGAKKSTRQNKMLVDKISAVIILQEYLENRNRISIP